MKEREKREREKSEVICKIVHWKSWLARRYMYIITCTYTCAFTCTCFLCEVYNECNRIPWPCLMELLYHTCTCTQIMVAITMDCNEVFHNCNMILIVLMEGEVFIIHVYMECTTSQLLDTIVLLELIKSTNLLHVYMYMYISRLHVFGVS